MTLTYWTGSNGNLFTDSTIHRYCIEQDPHGRILIRRNGKEMANGHTLAWAKAWVEGDAHHMTLKETI